MGYLSRPVPYGTECDHDPFALGAAVRRVLHAADLHQARQSGLNKGTLLADPKRLLQGTGKLIRHVPVATPASYRTAPVEALVRAALALAQEDLEGPQVTHGQTLSRIAG